jgi:hypothetical protein
MALKFQTSVADVVLRDVETGEAIAHGKTNISSALTQSMQLTEVRGGINNALLYSYYHDRAVEVNIEMATFHPYILALQSGQTIISGNYTVVATECVDLDVSGAATLDHTPTSEVTVIFEDTGASIVVTAVGSVITVAGGASRTATAIYDYTTTADRITVEVYDQPSTVELIMTARVYSSAQSGVSQYFQVRIPQFKLDGGYELSMTADGVSTQPLTGVALKVTADDCTTDDYYYTATYIDVDETIAAYSMIVAAPSPMTFSGSGLSQQITVLGYRGSIYSNPTITDECAYVRTSGCSTITVGSATGLVATEAGALSGDEATLTASYWDISSGSLTDTVYVVVS